MNDLTTAFAVPKSEGNARAEDVSKHSAVSRGEIAECSCEVVGRVGQVILSQSRMDEAVTPSGVTEDIVLQKMHLPEASVVSPNQKQTYISTPYSKINRKL